MASVIISEVHKRGYTTLVIDSMEDEKNFSDGASLMLARRVDGIIAVPYGTDKTLLESEKPSNSYLRSQQHHYPWCHKGHKRGWLSYSE